MIKYSIVFAISLIFSNSIYKEIKIYNPNFEIIHELHENGIHIDHAHYAPNEYLIFVVSEEELSAISSMDVTYEVLVDNLEAFYRSRLTHNYTREFGLGSMGGYYTFDEIVENLDMVHNECPDISTEKQHIDK